MARREVTVSQAKAAVDVIVNTLQHPDGGGGGWFTITEVIKGGSLGHGTVVPGHFDLDLVVYSDSVDGPKVLREGFDPLLDILIQYLEGKLPGKLSNKNRTAFSIQFKFDNKIDVDMLVSPFWREPSGLYRFLESIEFKDRYKFSVSASKWQVDFFSHQQSQVKEFIRRAKAWRNSVWDGGMDGKPKSYLMSVLVLRAYERALRNLGGDTSTRRIATETTKEVKSIVKNHQTVDIYWEKHYSKGQYPKLFPRQPPRIVDPANPSNNLYHTGLVGGHNSWGYLVSYIDSLDLTLAIESSDHIPDTSDLMQHLR